MEPLICLSDVTFNYSGNDLKGISDINMSVQRGEIVLITGRSGCGKTTLTRCINGMALNFYKGKMRGNVTINGKSTDEMEVHDIAFYVGTVFQDPRSQFFATITTNELAFGMENIGVPRREMIDRIDEVKKDMDIESLLDLSIFQLSSGEKQKIAVGSVCALKPSVLLFDEPSANIDAITERKIAKLFGRLKDKGHGIIIVEHRLHYLSDYVDRILYMDGGKITEEFTSNEFGKLTSEELSDRGLRFYDKNSQLKANRLVAEKLYNSKTILSVRELSFRKEGRQILKNVDMEMASGETLGIIGRNGAGKTTLLNVISGLLKETGGRVTINGKYIRASKRADKVYMVMQDSDYQLFTENVVEELLLGNEKQVNIRARVSETIQALNLEENVDNHPATLSGGEKQRVVIGAAMTSNSDVVLMDEPTSGLDFDNMVRVVSLVKKIEKEGRSVAIVSHDIEFLLNTCKRIIVLEEGSVIDSYEIDDIGVAKLKEYLCIEEF